MLVGGSNMVYQCTSIRSVWSFCAPQTTKGENPTNLKSISNSQILEFYLFSPLLIERAISVCLSYYSVFYMPQDRHFN